MNDDDDDLISEFEVALAAIFIAAMMLLRSGIDYAGLIIALRARDIEAAIHALHVEPGAFSGYVLERQSAFAKAGAVMSDRITADKGGFLKKQAPEGRRPTSRAPDVLPPRLRPTARPDAPMVPAAAPTPPTTPPVLPPSPPVLSAPGGGSVVFRFDMTNPRAEAKIRTEAASRVTGYVEEQIETARRVIADGFQRGEGPETIAIDIAGRINPLSGKREGGIIGLSDPQASYVENMRQRLLSGDPDEMLKVLGRFDQDGKWIDDTGMTLRDRRYDRSIQKAIKDVAAGKPNPLTDAKIDEMTAKYSDRLLKRRAEDIARLETAQGVEMARAEATEQALSKDGLPDDALTKGWVHQGGIRHARDSHLALNGATVVGMNTPFFLPDGSVMLYPHDPAGGAKNNANCRCRGDYNIDWAFGL